MEKMIEEEIMQSNEFVLRRSRRSDGPALNDVYQQLTGIARTQEAFEWEWFDTPNGPNDSFVIIDRPSQQVVGHHGVVKVPIRINRQKLLAGRTENTMLLPEFRKKINYVNIERHLLETIFKRYDLLITTSGKSAQYAIRKRLGYIDCGPWEISTWNNNVHHLAIRNIRNFFKKWVDGGEKEDNLNELLLSEIANSSKISILDPKNISTEMFFHLTDNPDDTIISPPEIDYIKWKTKHPRSQRYLLSLDSHAHPSIAIAHFEREKAALPDIRVEAIFCKNPFEALNEIAQCIEKLCDCRLIYRYKNWRQPDFQPSVRFTNSENLENMRARLMIRPNGIDLKALYFDGFIMQG